MTTAIDARPGLQDVIGEGDGTLVAVAGPVCRARGLATAAVNEVVRVGRQRLLAEVVNLDGDTATIQVYEETAGLAIGDPVRRTRAPLQAWLGPGLLGSTFDGLQRPLDALASAGHWLLLPGGGEVDARADEAGTGATGPGGRGVAGTGATGPGGRGVAGTGADPGGTGASDAAAPARDLVALRILGHRRWPFEPVLGEGDRAGPGDVIGEVAEGPLRHRILVPPGAPAGRLRDVRAGEVAVDETVAVLGADGREAALRLSHCWPVRTPRPVRDRLPLERPLVTGTRVIDMVFPVARGGTAVIPGGFGTGKTVVEQSLARWSDADVVVYVGCGERGNEMAELLSSFPGLVDPRTGGALLERTVLIANTSNMPVAAREASVQLGVTIAEYFRDQGLHVALLADSTSRWAEALREISGRLEELPGEEGFPAYLASRLALFYERAGRVSPLGAPVREGSVTIVGAVSPPGGDFSEPVTQASLRLAGSFWALDTELAHARHFPAIDWRQSYSLYAEAMADWYGDTVDPAWAEIRAEVIELLGRERQLLDIVQLVGADALPEEDRVLLEVARIVRETFLQQHAFDPDDASRPLDFQLALLRAVVAARDGMLSALHAGASLDEITAAAELLELRRTKTWADDDATPRLHDLERRLRRLEPVRARIPALGDEPAATDGPLAGAEAASGARAAAPRPEGDTSGAGGAA
jgi:V/A-type H+-transporting ATPase subunit A